MSTQSYMPAQETQVLKNKNYDKLSSGDVAPAIKSACSYRYIKPGVVQSQAGKFHEKSMNMIRNNFFIRRKNETVKNVVCKN